MVPANQLGGGIILTPVAAAVTCVCAPGGGQGEGAILTPVVAVVALVHAQQLVGRRCHCDTRSGCHA